MRKKEKKRSPLQIITMVSNPELESAYAKAPRYAPINVSKEREVGQVSSDEKKIEEYLNQTMAKSYTLIHTHPAKVEKYEGLNHWTTTRKKYSFPGIAQTKPSIQDVYLFLKNDKTEFDIVAQQNPNGTITGIHVLKKQKKPSRGALVRRADLMSDKSGIGWEYDPGETVKDMAKYFGLNYKFIPVSENHPVNIKAKQKSLEQKVSSIIAVSGILGSLFFLSSSVTGNAIANMSVSNSSFLGAGLLIVGLVAGFFWVKSRKK